MSKNNQAVKLSRDRILAIVLGAVSLIALFLPYTLVKNNGAGYTANSGLLFGGFSGTMAGAGLVSVVCIILMLLAMVASITLSVIAFLKEEYNALFIRIASLVMSAGAGFYALAIPTLTSYVALPTKFDVLALLVAIIGVGIYGWLLVEERKRAIIKPAAQYGATLLSTILLVSAVALKTADAQPANIIHIALIVLACAGLVFSQLCVMITFESPLLHRIRFIAQLAIALVFSFVCLFTLGLPSFIFAFLGAIVAAVNVAENFLNATESEDEAEEETEEKAASEYAYTDDSEAEEEYDENGAEPEMFPSIPRPQMAQEESLENPFKSYRVEEYAEAYAYEGGPVEGVELAEEVNPAFPYNGNPVATNGYDFYNCQSFDPFIASLNQEERNQFTELFILRYKGVMPEIPDYVVGGDNSEFFRMIFIYLGQYRERIPSGLLNKIYIYSTKIS